MYDSPIGGVHAYVHLMYRMTDLGDINAFRNGPGGHDVVHDSLAQRLRYVMQLHKLPNTIQHVVVPGKTGVELLEYCGHIAEDQSVQESWKRRRAITVR